MLLTSGAGLEMLQCEIPVFGSGMSSLDVLISMDGLQEMLQWPIPIWERLRAGQGARGGSEPAASFRNGGASLDLGSFPVPHDVS